MIKLIISQRTKDVKSDQHDQPYPYHPWSWHVSLHLPSKNNNHSWIPKYTNRPMVPWIRPPPSQTSLLSTKPSTAHKASVSAGMARLKAAALDKSARYFPFGREIGRRFFFLFSPKTNEEFVRTPDFLWKIHATGRFESKPIFQIKWSLGFWRHVTFSGVKLFGGGGL